MAAPMESGAIENYISGYDDSALTTISQGLLKREIKFVDVVELLGPFLTSTETSVRARATRLVSETLHHLPHNFLTDKEVQLLVTFLCEKLQDHHSLQPHALYGLLALSSATNFPAGCAEKVCRTIFKDVHTQSMAQGDRRTVFTIISYFLDSRLTELKAMEADFVYGYIQTMDAEKDPRNLIVAFHCAQMVIRNFSLGVFVEEMFEVVSCYFPIDFTPPPEDPTGISREDLIQGLRGCLAASPKFAQFCLPLLLEKLTSDIISAKIDALQTLSCCCSVYSPESLQEYQSSFFNCIRKEVCFSGDSTLEEACFTALESMVKCLSSGVTERGAKKSLDGFLDEMIAESKQHLLQPELKLMLCTGRLLKSVGAGSDPACCKIVHFGVPLMVEQFNTHTEPNQRSNILEVLNGFVGNTSKFKYSPVAGDANSSPNPIFPYRDSLVSLYISSLSSESVPVQRKATSGVGILFSLLAVLSEDQQMQLTQTLVYGVLNCQDVDLRDDINEALSVWSEKNPEIIESQVISHLMDRLKRDPMEVDGATEVDKELIFNTLSAVTYQCSQLYHSLTGEIIQYITSLTANHRREANLASQCLFSVTKSSRSCSRSADYNYSSTVNAVFSLVIRTAQRSHDLDILSSEVLSNLAGTVRVAVGKFDTKVLEQLYRDVVGLYLDGNTTPFNIEQNNTSFKPLSVSNHDQAWTSPLLTPVVCSGPTSLTIPRVSELLFELSALAQVSRLSESTHKSVIKCFAGLVNKHSSGEELDQLLTKVKTSLSADLEKGVDRAVRCRTLCCWCWIAKALVLRNHSLAQVFVDMLLLLLSDPDLGSEAAASFSVILTEYDDVMNKEMGAVIRLMYKQRFFIEYAPKLVQGFNEGDPAYKPNYLLAFSHLLKELPKQALLPELPKFFPLLVHSLLYENVDLQQSTMMTLLDLTQDAPDLVSKHIDSILPQLLKLAGYQPSMKVRMSALKCISGLVALPVYVIMPYQRQVTRSLEKALDDKKRLVRKQATSARMEWFLIDTDNK